MDGDLQRLGDSKLGQRQQLRVPDKVIEKLNLDHETPVIFYEDPKRDNVVIIKKGKVIDDE